MKYFQFGDLIKINNPGGERRALALTSPRLLVGGDKYPDDLYQHGRFVLDAREHNEGSKLETTLVSIEGSDSSLMREVSDNGSPGLELRPEATKALLAWLANHRSCCRCAHPGPPPPYEGANNPRGRCVTPTCLPCAC